MNKVYVIDIETNGFLHEFDTIWCIVMKDVDTGEVLKFGPSELEKAKDLLVGAKGLIGHNIIMFDLPALNKHLGLNLSVFNKHIFDTLIASRLLQPDRDGGHSLDAWGSRVGKSKLDFTDFSTYSDEMLTYCARDVDVCHIIFSHVKEDIRTQYDAFKLEQEFAQIIQYQVDNGFTLDISKVTKLYNELEDEYNTLHCELKELLPSVKDTTHYNKVVKDGLLLNEDTKGYTYETAKTKKITYKEFKYEEPNPGSRKQLIDYFISKGWQPKEYTEKNTPKISETILAGMQYPEARKAARMFRLQKQMGMIQNDTGGGWLNYVRDGKVHGDVITCGANTRRCTHSKPNLAQVDKKDIRMREVWVPREGWKLVGCDASGLELRILGHYLAPFDHGHFAYIASQPKEKMDLHEENRKVMGLMSRESAKTAIYALVYGAGNMKLASIYASDSKKHTVDIKDGYTLRRQVEDGFEGYKKLVEKVKDLYDSRGYLFAIDGGILHPRTDYSALNLLIQSAGAIVMKKALINFYQAMTDLGYKHGVDYGLVVNVHDEFITECRPDMAEDVQLLARNAIRKAGKDFNLKVELDGDARIGDNWAEVH